MSDPRDESFSSVPPPPVAPRPLPPAGWFPDPAGRHEHRYWDAAAWTDHVADRGVAAVDPVTGPAPASVASPAAVSTAAVSGVAPPPSVPADGSGWWVPEGPRVGPTPGPTRSLAGLATALTVMLWGAVGIAVLGVIAYANRASVVSDLLDASTFGELVALRQRADDADTFVGIVAVLLLACYVTTLVLLIIWMWRVAKNAETLGRTEPRFGPGWSIGGWFIPLANFVIPVLVMQDLWRGSDPEWPRGAPMWRTRPGSALVGWWWALWVTAQLLQIGGNSDGDAVTASELSSLRTQDTVAAFAMAAAVAAAILLLLVVRRLTRRQQALLGAQPPA